MIREQDDIHSAGATIPRKQSVWNQDDDEISAISQFAAFCAMSDGQGLVAWGGEFDAEARRVNGRIGCAGGVPGWRRWQVTLGGWLGGWEGPGAARGRRGE